MTRQVLINLRADCYTHLYLSSAAKARGGEKQSEIRQYNMSDTSHDDQESGFMCIFMCELNLHLNLSVNNDKASCYN